MTVNCRKWCSRTSSETLGWPLLEASPRLKRLVFMFRYVMYVSGSLGKSLLELIISAREPCRGLRRTRRRNAFHCSCEWANTFTREENDLGCMKPWQMWSQMRRSVWQPSRQWMNELWQKPQVTTSNTCLSNSSFIYLSLTHFLQHLLILSFSFYVSIFHSRSFLSPPPPTVTHSAW